MFSYSLAFLFGISVAKKELFKFESKNIFYILFLFSSVGYIISKLYNIPDLVTVLSRLVIIYSLLEILSVMNFKVLPDILKSIIEVFAKLSLYIYLTHLYFIEISYEMNKYFGVIIVLVMIFPICYIEYRIIEPVLKKFKKMII
jgi:peptidoglycan/LPS O-acetylase OafA/YrhL